jgi:hypothetical protein
MYGFEIPMNYEDATRLDKLHGNDKWKTATKLEMDQLHDYDTFHGKGGQLLGRNSRRYEFILSLQLSMMITTNQDSVQMGI